MYPVKEKDGKPDVPVYIENDDFHHHFCPKCGNWWSHDPNVCETDKQYENSHICECGEKVTLKYQGPLIGASYTFTMKDVQEYLEALYDEDPIFEMLSFAGPLDVNLKDGDPNTVVISLVAGLLSDLFPPLPMSSPMHPARQMMASLIGKEEEQKLYDYASATGLSQEEHDNLVAQVIADAIQKKRKENDSSPSV